MEDGDDFLAKCAPDRVIADSVDPDQSDDSKIPPFVFDRRPGAAQPEEGEASRGTISPQPASRETPNREATSRLTNSRVRVSAAAPSATGLTRTVAIAGT